MKTPGHCPAPAVSRPAHRFQAPPGIRSGESGVALILVMGFLVVVSLLALHMATSSEIAALQAKVLTERNRLKYEAESAANRVSWITMRYRIRHPRARYLLAAAGPNPGTAAEADEDEPWQADGTPHAWKAGRVRLTVRILDADNGIDLSGSRPAMRLRSLPLFHPAGAENPVGGEVDEAAQRFLDSLADYVDPDDLPRLDGKERAGYAAEGWPDLPRNGPLQMREEALWLPGIQVFSKLGTASPQGAGANRAAADLDVLRIIPPYGMAFHRSRSQHPNFFAADPRLIRAMLPDLSGADIALILSARRQWRQGRVPLQQTLPPELFARLRSRFSFSESGIATIVAVAEIHGIRRTLCVTRDLDVSGFLFRSTRPWIADWQKFTE